MRNIKIDTISKTITFEKSVTPSEIRHLIDSLNSYNIVIQEPTKEEVKSEEDIRDMLKREPLVFKEPYQRNNAPYVYEKVNPFEPPFNPTCDTGRGIIFHHNVNKPMFDTPICSEKPCYCSGKCKTKWAANNSNAFKWNLQGR